MASIFAGSDHIAHVKTQIPYAVLVAVISGVLYLLSSIITKGWVLLLIGVAALVILAWLLGAIYHKIYFTKEDMDLLKGKIPPPVI